MSIFNLSVSCSTASFVQFGLFVFLLNKEHPYFFKEILTAKLYLLCYCLHDSDLPALSVSCLARI